MRGIGSGRRGQWPIIEHGLKLDLRSSCWQGLFEPKGNCQFISLRWTSNATGETTSTAQFSYSTRPDGKWLRLQYAVTRYSDGERINVDETFRLEAFSQPFGGIRWYVICPWTVRFVANAFTFRLALHTFGPVGIPCPFAVLFPNAATTSAGF